MRLKPGGLVLGRYRVEGLLGEGAMGQVFRGLHEHLDLPVAIKVLHGAGTPDILSRFEREAKLMARVRHPNAVAVQDYGFLEDGSPCLVMEFLEGESLEDRLRRMVAMPWHDGLRLAQALLAGLGALHAAGVLHRDLKPSNVVLSGDPEVPKLIDFGIARPTDAEDSRITRTGVLVGTPAYMAPEQILCTALDARCDLYSLGLILYEAITGGLPFPSDTMASVMRRLKEEVPAAVAPPGLPQIPPAVADAVQTACRTDVEARPATARELSDLLRQAAMGGPTRDTPAGTTVTDETSPGWEQAADLAAVPPARTAPPPTGTGTGPIAANTAWDRIQSGGPLAEGQRYLIAARLPPSRIRNRDERRWLAGLIQGHGRAFTLGAHLWFAIQGAPEDPLSARRRAVGIQDELKVRYADAATVRATLVDANFALTGAALMGGAPLPGPLQDLITALNRRPDADMKAESPDAGP